MLALSFLLAAVGPAADPKPHDEANPLYRELRETGAVIAGKERVTLPAPSIADGLSAAQQQKAIQQVAGEDYTVEELVRPSVVTPFVLKLRDIKSDDPEAPIRGMDLWFVVYGSLEMDVGGAFIERALGSDRKDGQARELKPEELAQRNIQVQDKHETYGQVIFTFLERVEVQATGRAYWTKTADSFLAAAQLDPRFEKDADFPNRWRSIDRDDPAKRGPWKPYSGSAQYLKVTRLAEPPGALFAEYHLAFAEPTGWFDGANFLRSKLPPAAQQIVRSMRRELLKAQKK